MINNLTNKRKTRKGKNSLSIFYCQKNIFIKYFQLMSALPGKKPKKDQSSPPDFQTDCTGELITILLEYESLLRGISLKCPSITYLIFSEVFCVFPFLFQNCCNSARELASGSSLTNMLSFFHGSWSIPHAPMVCANCIEYWRFKCKTKSVCQNLQEEVALKFVCGLALVDFHFV